MVFAFGKPKNVTSYRSNTPTQDYINAVYNFGDFSICSEASWYASPYPFKAEFRFQFEKAVVANEDGAFKIYEADGEIIDYSAKSECEASDISIPKSNGYQNEIEYFIDCVLNNKQPETVKPDELETVIEILNNL
jgi:predicted dehydrogenase